MIITVIVCEVIEMDMTQILKCDMATCAYNMNEICHTPGINVGAHAECDFLTMIYPLYFQFQSNITTGLLFGGQTRSSFQKV